MFINQLFNKIYNEYYRKRFYNSSKDLRFHPKDSTFEYANISIGRRVFINRRAYFSAPNGIIRIGNDVLFGSDVFMAAGHHCYTEIGKTINKQKYGKEKDSIIIEDDVWIASKAIILGNVTIHEGAVVGAGSLVLKDIPPYCLYAGNPKCELIKYRYSDEELKKHLYQIGKEENEIEALIILRKTMTERMKP